MSTDYMKLESLFRERKQIVVYVEKEQKKPPYTYTTLHPLRKDQDGGIAILDLNKRKLITKPTQSKKEIIAAFKKIFPKIDINIITQELKFSDEYALNYTEFHQGRFKPFLD